MSQALAPPPNCSLGHFRGIPTTKILYVFFVYPYRATGRGHSGGQTARGDPKTFPRLKQPLFAVPALREPESACRVSIFCKMLSQYPQSAFQGSPRVAGVSAVVCDPNPPRPFAQSRVYLTLSVCSFSRYIIYFFSELLGIGVTRTILILDAQSTTHQQFELAAILNAAILATSPTSYSTD